jgi:hypothetical protein
MSHDLDHRSFVISGASGGRIRRDPSLIDDIKALCSNLAQWLAPPVAAPTATKDV